MGIRPPPKMNMPPSLLVLLGCVLAIDCADPVLPTLPARWQVTIEATIANKNYTMTQHEVYDYPNNRIHLSTRSPRSQQTQHTLQLLDLGLVLTWTGEDTPPSDCVGMPSFHSDGHQDFMADAAGHLRPSANFLAFGGANRTEVYQGRETVRGIECDAWLSTGSIPNYGWWNLTYYFVASDWSAHGSVHADVDSVPVRAKLVGAKTSAPAHDYYHIYEFIGWAPHSNDNAFLPPAQISETFNSSAEPRCDISEYCIHGGASAAHEQVCRDKNHEHTLAFLVSTNSTQVCSSSAEAPDPRCPFSAQSSSSQGANTAVAAIVSLLGGIVIGALVASGIFMYMRHRDQRSGLDEQVNMDSTQVSDDKMSANEGGI